MILFRDSLPNLNGYLRFLHGIPGAPNVDIYADDKLLYSNLAFGNVTDYLDLSPKEYIIQIYVSGTKEAPLVTDSVEVLPNSISTINIVSQDNEVLLLPINDAEATPDSSLSYVKFINLSPDSPLLSLSLPEDIMLFDEASYIEANNYYPLSPGIYNFIVSGSDSNFKKFISNVNLTPNLFVTIYIVGLMNGTPQIGYILLKDGVYKNKTV